MASVKITNLRKTYSKVVALKDIDCDIASGSFYTLLGPSGCGKTTLLRTIAGFHLQDAGQILVDGVPIQDKPAYQRNVGMVFQDYAVFPHLSVEANVAFGLKQRKIPTSEIGPRVMEALRIVQLDSFAARMPHELSGGQQQRVGLARAMVINPTVLLMDEPLSNLDAKLRVELRAELRRIQRDLGMTTVYVTHDQEEALAMSDIVCVMYDGIIQQAAPPFEIYRRPANRFVAGFVGANNFLALGADGALAAGGGKIADLRKAGAVAAIRPELIAVQARSLGANDLSLTVRVQDISFIGREAEVRALTQSGETVMATVRPTTEILGLKPDDSAVFSFDADEVLFYAEGLTGELLQ